MIPARNAIDAHAQNFMANDSRHYKSWKLQYNATLPARYSICLVFSVCVFVAELPVFPSAAILLDPSSVNIPPRQTHPLRRDHLLSVYSTALFLSLPLEQNIPECSWLLHRGSRTVTVPLSCFTKSVVYTKQTMQRWQPLLLKPAVLCVIWMGVSLVVISLASTAISP